MVLAPVRSISIVLILSLTALSGAGGGFDLSSSEGADRAVAAIEQSNTRSIRNLLGKGSKGNP